MVWGCMTSRGFGCRVQVDGNMDSKRYTKILSEGFLGTLKDQGLSLDEVIFQHNNNPKHTSRHTKAWLASHNVHVLNWPPNSPDQNIIENAWDCPEH